MPEWLNDSWQAGEQLAFPVIALRVALAAILGFVVAGVYSLTRERNSDAAPSLRTTLVLLSVLIALVTLVIGNSVARAFGLVGALSIVRFRTVVDDTRDTAFVIFAVVVGMACGAGYVLLAVVGIPIVALAALLMRKINALVPPNTVAEAELTVRIGLGHDAQSLLGGAFDKFLEHARLIAAGTIRQGAAFELTYSVRPRQAGEIIPFVAELNRIEGVQSAEWRQRSNS